MYLNDLELLKCQVEGEKRKKVGETEEKITQDLDK
jgi:hypothetical protein